LCWAWFIPEKGLSPENAAGSIEVTDLAGRTVHLDGPARRVMMLTPSLWHYLAVEMTGDHLLMLAPYMKKEVDESVFGKIYPELDDKPIMTVDRKGSAPFNIEETMMEAPDLVFVWEYLSAPYVRVGIPGLVVIRSDKGDKARLYEMLAGVTGKAGRVERLWESRDRRMALAAGLLEPASGPLSFVVLANDNFSLWSGEEYQRFNESAAMANGVNVAVPSRAVNGPLSMEALLALDPDVLLINFYNLAQNTLTVEGVMGDPRLAGLKAVLGRRVYHMPMGAMRLEGPVEEPLLMLWLAQIFNQRALDGYDLRDDIRQTFIELFNYHMSDDEIDTWLRYNENINSANHQIFGR
jgi:iron complex transport system substrate-binding protein